MKILLTGSTGQVGNALLQPLAAFGQIIAPTRRELDLSQRDSIREAIARHQPDLIINPAAYTGVDQAESETDLAHRINALAPQVMAQEAKNRNIGFIHFSTDYVFDGNKADHLGNWIPYLETDTAKPLNEYGKSKLAGELAIRATGCQHLIFRTSWVYSSLGKNFLSSMLRLANDKDELRIVNDQWGAPTSAGWLANVTCAIIQQLQNANDKATWWTQHGGVYHMTAAGKTTWQEFATEIMRRSAPLNLLTKSAPVIHGIPSADYPTPARRPHNSSLDNSKFSREFKLPIPMWQDLLQTVLLEKAHVS
jgi:dTDP-4-dehydrorhamnose reductase